MAKREFLQLAHTLDPKKHSVAGFFMSEKLDGMRCYWDGGITRGLPIEQVPWANTAKLDRLKDPVTATGLWTRYGIAIRAPGFWLDALPKVPLDGELYLGRKQFQPLVSITKSFDAGERWRAVKYMVFDSPPDDAIFGDGAIDTDRFKKRFKAVPNWIRGHGRSASWLPKTMGFTGRLKALAAILKSDMPVVKLHEQEQLPFYTEKAFARIAEFMNEVCDADGEGVMIKNPSAHWEPERSYSILKHKPWHDAEAEVVGYTWGRETDKGSKLLGLMGAAILKSPKGVFKCSGFTDEERMMAYAISGESAYAYGTAHPDEEVSTIVHNPRFPRGSILTYKYRELTDAGLPKEARFLRKAEDV